MILVDSSVWIDYFNGKITWQREVLDQMLQQIPVCTGDLIVAEVLQGFRSDSEFRNAKKIMSLLPCGRGGCGFAVKSAENYRSLRKKGITVRKTIDVIIGNIKLLHDDKDFEPMAEHLALKTVLPPFFA